MIYSGAWEKLIHEKNQKSKKKISWHCPFKNIYVKIERLKSHLNVLTSKKWGMSRSWLVFEDSFGSIDVCLLLNVAVVFSSKYFRFLFVKPK